MTFWDDKPLTAGTPFKRTRQAARYMAGELTCENLRTVLDCLIEYHPAECADALASVLDIQEDWRWLRRGIRGADSDSKP